ncbi:MAG: CAP domain-containing protein [Proteobacteria bacterium]|nr:CAP domain-containing protein [Pseudomonadota bacterium]
MSRVLLATALALAVTACSQGSGTLSSGFNDGPSETASLAAETRKARQGALGGEPAVASSERRAGQSPSNSGTRLASLDDKAPSGSFEKAPRGSLADRDFSGTKLNPEAAREAINAYRKQHGLKPLQINAQLTEAAKAHARDLAKWDRISHFGSDGSSPWDRVKRTGYNARLAAENVGTGQVTLDEVMKGWKDSPGHNKNLLLADAEQMGIALVHEPKTEFKTFWTLVIGAPL